MKTINTVPLIAYRIVVTVALASIVGCYGTATPAFDVNPPSGREHTMLDKNIHNEPITDPAGALIVSAVGGLAALASEASQRPENIISHLRLKTGFDTCPLPDHSSVTDKIKPLSLELIDTRKKLSKNDKKTTRMLRILTSFDDADDNSHSYHGKFEEVLTIDALVDYFLSHVTAPSLPEPSESQNPCREVPARSKLVVHHTEAVHNNRESYLLSTCSFLTWHLITQDSSGDKQHARIDMTESFARSILSNRVKAESNASLFLRSTCPDT